MGILDFWPAANRSSASVDTQTLDDNVPYQTSTDPLLVSSNRKYLVQFTQSQEVPTLGTSNQPIVVVGQVPEELQMDQQADYKAPWGAGLAGDGTISDLLAVTMGTRLLSQVQTLQVWQGSSNTADFTITLEFRAWSDVDRDVMLPLRALMSMVVPSVDPSTGWLRSPGPIIDAAAAKEIAESGVNALIDVGSAAKTSFSSAMTDGAGASKATLASIQSAALGLGKKLSNAKSKINNLMKNKIEIRIGDWFRLDNIIITNVQHTMRPQMPGPDGGIMSATATVSFRSVFALTTAELQDILQTAEVRSAGSVQQLDELNRNGVRRL